MATRKEFEEAFATAGFDGAKGRSGSIVVESRSGKRYWIHVDQLSYIPEGLIYGTPLKKSHRARGVAGETVWMGPENVKIVHDPR